MKLTVREYLPADGRCFFREWLDILEIAVRARIQARILRFEMGNLGDHKSVGGGVWEARLFFGPGYRIYFGKEGSTVIMLLLGGDKSSQRSDVAEAHRLWREYLEVTQHGKTQ
jgi:putative addiction module killer protein